MTDAAPRPVMALITGVAEYQLRLIQSMAAQLAEHRIPLLVVLNEPFGSDRTPSLVLDLIARHVPRGVIVLGDASAIRAREIPAALARAGVPTVALGTRLPDVPSVRGDNVTGMRTLMAHLLDDCGARRPVLVRGVTHQPDAATRERVFREELHSRGLPLDEELVVEGRFRHHEAYNGMRQLLARRQDFDAVVALNDLSAVGALSAVTDHGLRVPQDLLVAGFDNTEGSILCWPALTTVDQGLAEQGHRAVELLLELLAGAGPRPDILVPTRLVTRASTATAGSGVLNSSAPEHLATMPGARIVAGVPVIGVQELSAQLEQVVTTARALQSRVTLQGAALSLNWTMAHCRTVDDIIAALDPCLNRLGVRRCFLGIDAARTPAPVPATDYPTRLVLSFRAGAVEASSPEVFPRHHLLPSALRPELDSGVLLLQPLSIAGRERGYLLYEPVAESALLTEALRIDLPRAVDTVLSSAELHSHAATLDRLVARRTRQLQLANAELRRSAARDGLTGIANRTAFEEFVEELSGPGAPSGTRLAMLMIDVDMFKAYNDRYGHVAGDMALRTVAACLTEAVQDPRHLACRYGGEEFAVVLAEGGQAGAVSVAERFRQVLAEAAVPHEASPVASVVTASIGIASATVHPGFRPIELIAAADRALYRAKLRGRDRVVTAGHGRDQVRRGATGLTSRAAEPGVVPAPG